MKWWQQTDWEKEDLIYKPKRRISNRNSHSHPHMIGSFYSEKMGRPVNYESLGERLFYYYLELDKEVIRYYEQPVEVPAINAEGKNWNHVPDVLFFRRGATPFLCQVKENEETAMIDAKLQLINHYCEKYALSHGWRYEVIFPKDMPVVLARNLKYLKRYLRPRRYYEDWEDRVVQRVIYLECCTIRRLVDTFDDKIDPLALLPLIYHLISKGVLSVDFSQVIGPNTLVSINKRDNSLSINFKGGIYHGNK